MRCRPAAVHAHSLVPSGGRNAHGRTWMGPQRCCRSFQGLGMEYLGPRLHVMGRYSYYTVSKQKSGPSACEVCIILLRRSIEHVHTNMEAAEDRSEECGQHEGIKRLDGVIGTDKRARRRGGVSSGSTGVGRLDELSQRQGSLSAAGGNMESVVNIEDSARRNTQRANASG